MLPTKKFFTQKYWSLDKNYISNSTVTLITRLTFNDENFIVNFLCIKCHSKDIAKKKKKKLHNLH